MDDPLLQAPDFLLVLCTCPHQQLAEALAAQIISNSLAGCVNILPSLQSIYRWQGNIEKQQESLLLIKTHRVSYLQLELFIKKMHPYEVPEIIAIPLNHGSTEYLAWLRQYLNYSL